MQGWLGRNQLQWYCHFLPLLSSCAFYQRACCPVCQTDQACAGFPLPGELRGLDDEPVQNMTCYKGGLTVNTYYQMCDVTSESFTYEPAERIY